MKSFAFQKQINISLREKVTNQMREAILKGAFQPGDRLRENEIAEQMGVSRAPVREAIRHLQLEGLVISHPYRETVVSDLQVEEVREILIPIRFHLEWFVIKKYINQMDESFFEELQSVIGLMESNINDNSIDELVELDIRFHQNIIQLANERTVALTWQSILNQIRLHFVKNISFFNIKDIQNEHQLLLETMKTKNLQDIQNTLVQHLKGDQSFLCFMN